MIKTFTQKNNIGDQVEEEIPDAILENLFYESLKTDLDKLLRNPEETTIQEILDYSKKMI